jgi:hypothetical protein
MSVSSSEETMKASNGLSAMEVAMDDRKTDKPDERTDNSFLLMILVGGALLFMDQIIAVVEFFQRLL